MFEVGDKVKPKYWSEENFAFLGEGKVVQSKNDEVVVLYGDSAIPKVHHESALELVN